jgi:hypothetical protein
VPSRLLDHRDLIPVQIVVAVKELGHVLYVRLADLRSNSVEAPPRDRGVAEHREGGQVSGAKVGDPSPVLEGPERGQSKVHLRWCYAGLGIPVGNRP